MLDYSQKANRFLCSSVGRNRRLRSSRDVAPLLGMFLAASALAALFSTHARAQQTHPAETPVVVQPGAPGKPSKTLPPSTKATLPPRSKADVEFMQGMIMHH